MEQLRGHKTAKKNTVVPAFKTQEKMLQAQRRVAKEAKTKKNEYTKIG